MEGTACPKCGEGAVEFEEVEGVSACQVCGWVLLEEQLVHATTFDAEGTPLGLFVRGDDTGERAAAYALQANGTGLAIQHSRHSGGEAKLKARVREFGSLLHLQPPVVEQAVHVLEQAVPHCMGSWRRDHLAAAATYTACRLNKLPLTLSDVSAVTQLNVHTLGHYYCAICRLLDLQPPLLLAADLLPRSADRVMAEAVRQGKLAAATVGVVQRDAGMLLDWMQRQLERRQFPMSSVGAALVLAAEMNTVSLSLRYVSASLPLARSTLERKLAQTRQRLVQLAAFLPYSSSINSKNVGSHARTIIKLSALVGSTAPGGAGDGTVVSGSSLTAGNIVNGALPLQLEGQQEQPADDRAAPLPISPASAIARQNDGGEGAAGQKRARVQGPDSLGRPPEGGARAVAQSRTQSHTASEGIRGKQQPAAPG